MLGNKLANGAISKMVKDTYDQEGSMIDLQKISNHNPISRRYPRVKNPRIARVSRDFGGKDRHSKVWTVKGLRDRRIRLSVPTAIDLYHLQDQLGLTQPSKVIDWLIDVTKDDIDKLPPLQIPLEDFNRFHLPSTFVPQDFHSTQLSISPYFNTTNYDHQRARGNEAIGENKPNTFNYHELYPSSNLSLSRPDHQLDTYASLLPPALGPPSEPQVSCFSGITTPSFFSPCFMPNHFQLLNSNSPHGLTNSLVPTPLNLMEIDTEMKLPFGLNMNTNVSSQSNDNE